jgi:hypothetical protein
VITSDLRARNAALGPDTGPGTRSPMIPIEVTWLLKNPFGASAQPGQRGDFVRVSDDRATIYLLPNEFDHADERKLRWLLAQQPTRAS